MMAYRSSVLEGRGFPPSMLMIGREIQLPVDLVYGQHPQTENNAVNESEYLDKLISDITRVHNNARDKMVAVNDRQKRQYDHKINFDKYKVGDAVWVFNPSKIKGKSPKLLCNWTGPFLVVAVYTDLIYKVTNSPDSKERLIHHDKLKPFIGKFRNLLAKSYVNSRPVVEHLVDQNDGSEKENKTTDDKTRKGSRQIKPPQRYSH